MKRFGLGLLISVSVLTVWAGRQNALAAAHPGEATPIESAPPVTRAEAHAAFERIVSVTSEVTGLSIASPGLLATPGSAIATREEIVLELTRILHAARPAFKLSPRPVEFDASVLQMKDPEARRRLEALVEYGFVAPVAPLATGPGEGISPGEFGDALGIFLARLSEATHRPTREYSPYLWPAN